MHKLNSVRLIVFVVVKRWTMPEACINIDCILIWIQLSLHELMLPIWLKAHYLVTLGDFRIYMQFEVFYILSARFRVPCDLFFGFGISVFESESIGNSVPLYLNPFDGNRLIIEIPLGDSKRCHSFWIYKLYIQLTLHYSFRRQFQMTIHLRHLRNFTRANRNKRFSKNCSHFTNAFNNLWKFIQKQFINYRIWNAPKIFDEILLFFVKIPTINSLHLNCIAFWMKF